MAFDPVTGAWVPDSIMPNAGASIPYGIRGGGRPFMPSGLPTSNVGAPSLGYPALGTPTPPTAPQPWIHIGRPIPGNIINSDAPGPRLHIPLPDLTGPQVKPGDFNAPVNYGAPNPHGDAPPNMAPQPLGTTVTSMPARPPSLPYPLPFESGFPNPNATTPAQPMMPPRTTTAYPPSTQQGPPNAPAAANRPAPPAPANINLGYYVGPQQGNARTAQAYNYANSNDPRLFRPGAPQPTVLGPLAAAQPQQTSLDQTPQPPIMPLDIARQRTGLPNYT